MVVISRAARAAVCAGVAVAATWLSPCGAQAQGGRAESRYGVLAGASIASISDLDKDFAGELGTQLANKSRVGAQAAVYARIPVKGMLSLQPELHYIQKGGKLELSDASVSSDAAQFGLKIAYVEVPILARLELGAGTWRPFLTVGPTIALRTSCKVSFGAGGATISTACDASEFNETENTAAASEDPVKKTDIGASAGFGLAGTLMGRTLFAQLRYNQGLTTIATNAPSSQTPKNRGFSIVMGLGF